MFWQSLADESGGAEGQSSSEFCDQLDWQATPVFAAERIHNKLGR